MLHFRRNHRWSDQGLDTKNNSQNKSPEECQTRTKAAIRLSEITEKGWQKTRVIAGNKLWKLISRHYSVVWGMKIRHYLMTKDCYFDNHQITKYLVHSWEESEPLRNQSQGHNIVTKEQTSENKNTPKHELPVTGKWISIERWDPAEENISKEFIWFFFSIFHN